MILCAAHLTVCHKNCKFAVTAHRPSAYSLQCIDCWPSEVASPLCEVDGHRDIAHKRHKDNDSNPGLQRSGKVDTGSCNVKELRPNVEDNSGQDALNGAGAPVHDSSQLPGLSVQVEVEVQVQGVHKHIQADAPAMTQGSTSDAWSVVTILFYNSLMQASCPDPLCRCRMGARANVCTKMLSEIKDLKQEAHICWHTTLGVSFAVQSDMHVQCRSMYNKTLGSAWLDWPRVITITITPCMLLRFGKLDRCIQKHWAMSKQLFRVSSDVSSLTSLHTIVL